MSLKHKHAGLLMLIIAVPAALAQQVADKNFDTRVARPAYTRGGPRVLFDEAHHNFHTMGGRYQPFSGLMTNDGYALGPNRVPFRSAVLKGYDLLVIANALGAENMGAGEAAKPAFTLEECRAVRKWIRRGGSLLLIADHAPMGVANQILARELGVVMGEGFTYDPKHSVDGSPSLLEFSRENGLLAAHAITAGRDASERVSRVVAFTGQSLKGPNGSTTILRLADSAYDQADRTSKDQRPVAGPAQCLVFALGRGRVAVVGEAAMLTAQLGGWNQRPMGMNVPGNDDRQFALNLMHWLTRVLN